MTNTYLILFGAVFSTVFIPLPEEVTLMGAGYLARDGEASLLGAFLVAWIAILLGDALTFYVGRTVLDRLLKSRLGSKLVSPKMRAWAEKLVARNGTRAIIIGRFLVALRGPVYLAIGQSGYPPAKFLLVNALVGFFEVSLMVGVGYLFHPAARSGQWIDLFVALVLVVALFGPMVAKSLINRGVNRGADAPG